MRAEFDEVAFLSGISVVGLVAAAWWEGEGPGVNAEGLLEECLYFLLVLSAVLHRFGCWQEGMARHAPKAAFFVGQVLLLVPERFGRVYLGGVARGHYRCDQRDDVRNHHYQRYLEP